MTNPIDQPDYNPATYRPPNEVTMATIKAIADDYHALTGEARIMRAQLDAEIIAAKEAGHSYPQLREASGLSVATIQKIIERKDYK